MEVSRQSPTYKPGALYWRFHKNCVRHLKQVPSSTVKRYFYRYYLFYFRCLTNVICNFKVGSPYLFYIESLKHTNKCSLWFLVLLKPTIFYFLIEHYLSGQEDDVAVGARMLYLSRQVNTLKERVETEHLYTRRSTVWKEATAVVDFPRLSEERLRELTTYQLKLSKSYIQEHVDGKNRHTILKSHVLWISYSVVILPM